MYILINTDSKVFVDFSNDITLEPTMVEFNDKKIRYSLYDVMLLEVASIPEGVEVEKYIYDNGVFSANPNYKEPIDLEQRIIDLEAIIDTLLNGGTV